MNSTSASTLLAGTSLKTELMVCELKLFDLTLRSVQQHTFVNNYCRFCRTDFTGYVLFIITSFLAGVESTDQCLLNSKVLSCFSGVIMSIRSFFLLRSVQ